MDVYVVPDLCDAYKYLKEKEALEDTLAHWQAINEKDDHQHVVATSCFCMKKRDAVTHF